MSQCDGQYLSQSDEGDEEDLYNAIASISDFNRDPEVYIELNNHICLDDSDDSLDGQDASGSVLPTERPEPLPALLLRQRTNEITSELRNANILCNEEEFIARLEGRSNPNSVLREPPTPAVPQTVPTESPLMVPQSIPKARNKRFRAPRGFVRKVGDDWKPVGPQQDFQVKRDEFPAL